MPTKPFINVVGTECDAKEEVRFNKWYNEVHIPMLMKCKQLKSAARYKVGGTPQGMSTYLAVYEFESKKDFEAYAKSAEFKAAIDEMNQSWPTGMKIAIKSPYELIKQW